MTTEAINERISIKNILFPKAIPNYKIPIPTDGHKLFSCTDCGDKFIFESSLVVHINRKSLKIHYNCRYCAKINVFFNRCQFLSHIRSHVSKTATINLCDLIIDPLPMSSKVATSTQNIEVKGVEILNKSNFYCYECKKSITVTTSVEKDRGQHYMHHLCKFLTCPVCLFTVASTCALIAHLRIHLKIPPFFCPECGMQLPLSACIYPYNHKCDGFKMMRVTSRIKCLNETCPVLHPNNYIAHMSICHVNRIFKCPSCYLAGYNENAVLKHVMKCCDKTNYPTYFECQQCPGIFLSSSQINKHFKDHLLSVHKYDNIKLYPCWNCGFTASNVHDFLQHHVLKHSCRSTVKTIIKVINNLRYTNCISCLKKTYFWNDSCENVLNKCISCLQDDSSESLQLVEVRNEQMKHPQIECYLCRMKVNENWDDVKKHFNKFHDHIKCLDLKLVLDKVKFKKTAISKPKTKTLTKHFKLRKRQIKLNVIEINKPVATVKLTSADSGICPKCYYKAEDKQSYESHIKTHRDPDMAYQCMECGQCFAVKPSFSTHLLLEHCIVDVNNYVQTRNCFNENALETYQVKTDHSEEDIPIEENQCIICREKFSDSKSLEKHFRVHGMAFLIKNTQKSKSP